MKWKPCYYCGRYGSERVGGRAVTAPEGVTVKEGEDWTCVICVERDNRPQVAGRQHELTE